jgi:hypothetical protein
MERPVNLTVICRFLFGACELIHIFACGLYLAKVSRPGDPEPRICAHVA